MPLRLLALFALLVLGSTGGVLLLAGYASLGVPVQPATCASPCAEGRYGALLPAERAERFARVFRE